MTDTNVSDPLKTEEFSELYLYDKALISKFTEGTVKLRTRSRDVPIIMGTAQRAFSELRDLYGLTDPAKRVPLPVGNLISRDVIPDMTRYLSIGSSAYGTMRVSEPKPGIQKRMVRPFPVTIAYTMQIRMADMIQRNQIVSQITLITKNEKFVVPVTIPDFGRWNMHCSWGGVLDSSEYDTGEFDKAHVLSVNFIYEGWLFYPTSIHYMVKGAGISWDTETVLTT
jgi:hypothetical protein